jgi:hypothetical protein
MDVKPPAINKPSKTTEPTFKTPGQISAADNMTVISPLENNSLEDGAKGNKKMPKKKRKFWPPSKFGWIVIVLAVILIGSLIYAYTQTKKVKPSSTVIKIHKPAAPAVVYSSLSGLPVSPATNKLPITAVMVENNIAARPQSGLGSAGVVFEALAEGGITRFVALYQSDDSTSIGPVRSARPYYISWILGFDADYAHVGGSPEALSDITQWNVKNMDEFANGSSFERISSRQAPHNVYTSTAQLSQLETSKGYTSSTFTSWKRKTASPLKKPTASTINLTMSGPDYNDSYTYNPATNDYSRVNGGAPQIDANNNQQIKVPVVIAIVVPESNGPLDSSNAYYSEYQTIGSGSAYIFQDGGVTLGQWTKTSNTDNIQFTTTTGKTIPLNPGEVWITAVTQSSAVSYQ